MKIKWREILKGLLNVDAQRQELCCEIEINMHPFIGQDTFFFDRNDGFSFVRANLVCLDWLELSFCPSNQIVMLLSLECPRAFKAD